MPKKTVPRVQSTTILAARTPYLVHRETISADCIKDIQSLMTQGWVITECRLQRPISDATTTKTQGTAGRED